MYMISIITEDRGHEIGKNTLTTHQIKALTNNNNNQLIEYISSE